MGDGDNTCHGRMKRKGIMPKDEAMNGEWMMVQKWDEGTEAGNQNQFFPWLNVFANEVFLDLNKAHDTKKYLWAANGEKVKDVAGLDGQNNTTTG